MAVSFRALPSTGLTTRDAATHEKIREFLNTIIDNEGFKVSLLTSRRQAREAPNNALVLDHVPQLIRREDTSDWYTLLFGNGGSLQRTDFVQVAARTRIELLPLYHPKKDWSPNPAVQRGRVYVRQMRHGENAGYLDVYVITPKGLVSRLYDFVLRS